MSRTQHDRQRDHAGYDLDSNIKTSAAVGGLPAGSLLSSVLALTAGGGSHYEVLMADFGSGLEPVVDASGDWLYGIYGA